MARLGRIVAVNVAHHVTQGGNARQSILAAESHRLVYLQLSRYPDLLAMLNQNEILENVPAVPRHPRHWAKQQTLEP
jgi:hypothetical protein